MSTNEVTLKANQNIGEFEFTVDDRVEFVKRLDAHKASYEALQSLKKQHGWGDSGGAKKYAEAEIAKVHS